MTVRTANPPARPASRPSLRSKLSDGVLVPISRFWRVYSTVLVEGLRDPRQRRRTIPLWIFEFAAAFCQGLVIATLAYGVRLASQPDRTGDLVLRNLPFLKALFGDTISPHTILAGTILLSSIFLVGSVVARYFSAIISRRMGRTFHQRLTAGVIAMGGQGRLIPVDHIKSNKEVHFAAIRNAIHVSKAFTVLVTIVPTAVFCAFFFAVTFMLIWEVSAIIALTIVFLVPVCLHVSRRIHSAASSYFNLHAQRFGEQVGTAIAGMDAYFAPTLSKDPNGASRSKAIVYDDRAEEYFDHFDAIQLASARMGFMTGLVKAVIFAVGLASLCTVALLKQLDYSVIVTFATALYVSFNFMQSLLANLATMNVFYPQVSHFYALTKAWQAGSPFDPRPTTDRPDVSDALPVFRSQGPKSAFAGVRLESVEVPRGSLIDLVTAGPIGRFNVKHWLEPLARASKGGIFSDDVTLFNSRALDLSPLTLADIDSAVSQHAGYGIQDIAEILEVRPSLETWIERRAQSPQTLTLSREALGNAGVDVWLVLYVAAAMASPARYVFFDGGLIRRPRETQLRELMSNRFTFVWRAPTVAPSMQMDWRFLLKDGRLAAILPGDSDLELVLGFYPDAKATQTPEVDDITVLG